MAQDESDVPFGDQLLISQAAERLKLEFEGTLAAETIERLMTEVQNDLRARATAETMLPPMVERFARDRLRALALVEGRMTTDVPTVLFLCVHNAGRSQMAAGWLRHLGGDRVEVFSGGSEPAADVNPAAVQAMAEIGIDIAGEFPRPWTDEIVRAVDVVVSMGCGDACPVYPGKRYEDWELTDPAGQPIEVVRTVRDEIEARVRRLMKSLDLVVRV